MKALTLQRTSAAKAGWIIGLLFFAWLAFLLVPVPRSWTNKVKPVVAAPPSKLRAAGLADNPDWDGLPELFAIWSDSAEWRDDKTQFAYWHPGGRSYSYFFEATRRAGKIRFRPLPKSEAFASRSFMADGTYQETDAKAVAARIVEPEFEKESPTHPFVFFRLIDAPRPIASDLMPNPGGLNSAPPIAPLEVKLAPPPLPAVETKNTSAPDDPKKK